ncbi:MAG: diacylglycerol/lipid kinase family protein [Actinomycetota bacterium]
MIRAHLVMNPEARRVTPALLRVIAAALESRLKLEVTETHARDAGIEIGRNAAGSGCELVIAFGGDGLVNEVVNGIAGTDAALGIIPGGTMNVLARNLGIPRDPLKAADHLLQRVGHPEPHLLALGRANGRYFTFASGCGFDAEVAARVEAHREAKRRYGEAYFYAAALGTFTSTYLTRRPYLRCEGSFGTHEAVLAIALTAGPYAYLAGWPVRLAASPQANGAMQVFMLRRLVPQRLPLYAAGVLSGRFGRHSSSYSGIGEMTVTGREPVPYHVDGESLPAAEHVHVRMSGDVLPVVI